MDAPRAKKSMPVIDARGLHKFINGDDQSVGLTEALDNQKSALSAEDQEAFEDFVAKLGMAKSELDAGAATAGELWAPDNATLCLMQSYLSEQIRSAPPKDGVAAVSAPQAIMPGTSVEAKFDDADVVSWAGSFFTWWRRTVKSPFKELPLDANKAIPIPDDTSLALFADWGVGPLYGAVIVKETIDDPYKIPDPLAAAIHLGDTYYSGTEDEVAHNLIDNFPSLRQDVRRLTLNGNHEMYGGARGYYKALEEFGQPCSYFALQNKGFTIICLDTAYEDFKLAGQQLEWCKRIINQAGGSRKIILLSHHQPFSAFEPGGKDLVAQLDPILQSGRILAWYWGHEHRCVVYNRHPKWSTYGRCIGHGGYPYFRPGQTLSLRPSASQPVQKVQMAAVTHEDNSLWYSFGDNVEGPGGMILADDNRYMRDDHAKYGAQGFVMLDMRGGQATERFLRPDGTPILTQVLKP
jgi:hypothetical protein